MPKVRCTRSRRPRPLRWSIPLVVATPIAPGLMTGMHKGMDWPTCGRLAGLLGAIKIAERGGQNHRFTWDEIVERFKAEYGYSI
jgi:hypothetical protein